MPRALQRASTSSKFWISQAKNWRKKCKPTNISKDKTPRLPKSCGLAVRGTPLDEGRGTLLCDSVQPAQASEHTLSTKGPHAPMDPKRGRMMAKRPTTMPMVATICDVAYKETAPISQLEVAYAIIVIVAWEVKLLQLSLAFHEDVALSLVTPIHVTLIQHNTERTALWKLFMPCHVASFFHSTGARTPRSPWEIPPQFHHRSRPWVKLWKPPESSWHAVTAGQNSQNMPKPSKPKRLHRATRCHCFAEWLGQTAHWFHMREQGTKRWRPREVCVPSVKTSAWDSNIEDSSCHTSSTTCCFPKNDL